MSNAAPLRIAQVAPTIFPVPPADHGGTERVIFDLTEALVAAGHEVTLFAAAESQTSATLCAAVPSLRMVSERVEEPGMAGVLEAANLAQLRTRLAAFDVLHCHTDAAHAAVLGPALPRSLTTIHWRADGPDRQQFFSCFPSLPVAAISADQARSIPSANLRGVVHHGIDALRFRRGAGGGPLTFLGRMTDQKQPDAAIRIARTAGCAIELAGTVDVGNPTYFRDRVEPLLGGGAVYLGPVGDIRKQLMLGSSRALIFPISWPEPFGLVMIEAMACGTPVIAFGRGSVPEIVEDGVTGFVVNSEEEAAAAVLRLGELDRRRIRAQFEKRFTASRMAADYIHLYRALAP